MSSSKVQHNSNYKQPGREIKTAFKEGLHEEMKSHKLNRKTGNIILLKII